MQKDTSVYEQDIALKSVKAIEKFYDKAQGLFVSGEQRQISYATNVWYVLAEVFGQKENAFIFDAGSLKQRGPFCRREILCSFDKIAILHLYIVMILVILTENLLQKSGDVIYFRQRYFV